MVKNSLLFLLISSVALLFACKKNDTSVRDVIQFTKDWKFVLDDQPEFKETGYNDSAWRTLNLPHDWSIEGEFSENNPATPGGGALPGGTGWYRKTFTVAQADTGKQVFIEFDGIYRNSEVWINGHLLGKRPNGYISFRYDLTPYLQFNDKNLVAVRVDNSAQPNSRWYSGSGIYRNVWLIKTNKVHVAQWGTYITTPVVSKDEATIQIETTIGNDDQIKRNIILKTLLLDAVGEIVVTVDDSVSVAAGEQKTIIQNMQVEKPNFWSINDPYLYRVKTLLNENGKDIDTYTTNTGIRYFNFDAEKGFSLNGEPLKILGVCNHHDLGCLGAAINTRALERQLQLLKEMGCNAIRTSHNPPAPELLDLCDKMGFIVMDETFDMWRKKKSPYDYGLYFAEWHEKDLSDHIIRDRNHPSVFMWSIGNEILEQWNHVDADTLNLQQANLLLNFDKNVDETTIHSKEMNVNSLLTIKLANIVKNLDPTRPVTSGNNEVNPWNNLFKSGAMDLYGFNYHVQTWPDFHANFPGKKLVISESTSALMTRGYYQMPSDSILSWPTRGKTAGLPYGNPEQQCSSYDNCHAPWGSTHEETWKMVKKTGSYFRTFYLDRI
ncbi:MAG: sugar-binding domain-containing protein [Mangrovibacterium sp.]